jgi:hypothetical protein
MRLPTNEMAWLTGQPGQQVNLANKAAWLTGCVGEGDCDGQRF